MIPTSVLNHLWQSTLFAIAAGLLALALRKNRAPERYWLWFAASVKFLIPFSLLVTIGHQFEWRTAPAGAQPQFSSVVQEISQPFAPEAPALVSARKSPTPNDIQIALRSTWLCGLFVVVIAWARQWLRVRRALFAASPVQLNLPIQAMSSPEQLEPGVFGVFRPVLLLPEGITDRLTPAQWEAILAHELCHVRRRDNLTAAIHMLVEAIFWFHPLLWWIGKRLVDERERACDEEVLLAAGDPAVYAEGILNVCKLYLESPLPCVSGVTGSNLKKRIRAIMTERVAGDLHFAKKVALAVAGIAALALPIAFGILNAPRLMGQSMAATAPKFEVASIRPDADCADAGTRGSGGAKGKGGSPDWSPGTLNLECLTVDRLIQMAYGTFANGQRRPPGRAVPIEGGPAWINSIRYTIHAKAEEPQGEVTMKGPMLQALLEDRFKLKIGYETKQVPVYALTVAKGGPKNLKVAQEGNCFTVDADHPRRPPPEPGEPGPRECGMFYASSKSEGADVLATTLETLSRQFSAILDRDVIDKTGIAGVFDLRLEMSSPKPAPDANGGPGKLDPDAMLDLLQEAVQKLGLNLEPAKAPQESLVIDHVEKPSENLRLQ
jgi:bla regulator protein blaR1